MISDKIVPKAKISLQHNIGVSEIKGISVAYIRSGYSFYFTILMSGTVSLASFAMAASPRFKTVLSSYKNTLEI